MESLLGSLVGIVWLPVAVGVLFLLAFLYILVKSRWKSAKGNEVLVVSGTRKGIRVYQGGGAFVSPFQEHDKFTTEVLTLSSDGKEAPTKPKIPVVVDWTAQIRPDDSSDAQLIRAYKDFYGAYKPEEIMRSLEQTLTGELRNVIGEMDPSDLLHKKDEFNSRVTQGASERMKELGFYLVNLNLADVTDRHGYFDDMAAEEREAKRQSAANIKADSAKNIAVAQAEATRQAEHARITSQLAVDERERDAAIKRAEYKSQRDVAEANAAVAGELQRTEREREVAANRGAVAVVEAEQDQRAAAAQRAAALTRAETERQRIEITAQAEARQAEIAAQAEARQAEIEAQAAAIVAQRTAEGEAQAAIARAQGQAEAITKTTEARTDEVRRTGLAAAEVAQAQGEAEAAAILARGRAEAEAQRLMADALAANDGANLKVTLAQIDRDTTIQVYTTVGEAMARIGEHATFIDMGGSSNGGGDLLTKVLGNMPELLKRLDVKSAALNNGTPFGGAVGSLIASLSGQPVVRSQNESTPSGASLVDKSVSDEPAASDASEGQIPGNLATVESTER